MESIFFNRRTFLQGIGSIGALAALEQIVPAYARTGLETENAAQIGEELSGEVINLTISETPVMIGNKKGTAKTINGTLPGPIIRLKEGQDVTLNVTNRLKETSSIHWHGLLVPPAMDGVPGVSFAGIEPGETFVYKFRVKQSGTYWYHSHSPGQEQAGVYAPLIIDPAGTDPVKFDREYVVVLSDWSFMSEMGMIGKLKKQSGYFNMQRRTMREFLSNAKEYGLKPTWQNYTMWAQMRMDPTDFADATGSVYTYLMNGRTTESNWTGIFTPGERIRLRFINVGAMTFHDIRIPGLKMTVVQADGQNVQPVEVDEFRFGPAETYDVIVTPTENRAYTIFSEVLDRSGFVRGTLAPRPGMSAEIPDRRPRPLRTMQNMGMSMEGMDPAMMKVEMGENAKAGGMPMSMDKMDMSTGKKMQMPESKPAAPQMDKMEMPKTDHMNMPGMDMGKMSASPIPGSMPVKHGPDKHGIGNQISPETTVSQLDKPGIGLGGDGRKVLVYTDLKALEKFYDTREPQRELELHATGHMERFMWSFDGKKFSAAEPVRFKYGERLRWTFVNDTMMEHTFHLHGMWMHLENGMGDYLPRKHTVIVKPAERVSVAVTPDERGPWAFHCHLIMHMEAGMFRVVVVSDELPPEEKAI
ncbi:MAG: copper resistance system multicopper oxidase [Acidobacteriota bacterium]|nr:MAG: copper resistance system multicopper oxidase [Acidobacteriota bacterium]